MDFKSKFQLFEEEFINEWGEYRRLHDELNTYRGKDLAENLSRVNQLIREIQEKFHHLYSVFVFVKERGSFCAQAVGEYQKFIDDIKKAGAIEEKEIIS